MSSMEPATKKVRIEEPTTGKTDLKPSQVTTTSNIFGTIDEDDSEEDAALDESMDDASEDDELDIDEVSSSEEEAIEPTTKRKKNDPEDFANAMSKILASGLSTAKRTNPILARSIESKRLDEATLDEKITEKAKRQLNAEKKLKLEKNHNGTVIGATDEEQARVIERERQLRKVAQRGVVRLFNAMRASQTSALTSNSTKQRETAQETSKSSFLDMIKGNK